MKLDGYCPGCGGGAGNQGCAIAKCSLRHGGLEYCFRCGEYPCEKYENTEVFDSFITHRNQLSDMEKAQTIGMEQYRLDLGKKAEILQQLLQNYNDGRHKSFFCIAANLLEVQELKAVMDQISLEICNEYLSIKEKAVVVERLLQTAAKQRCVELKLNKKPSKRSTP
jgi:hypothetical protein